MKMLVRLHSIHANKDLEVFVLQTYPGQAVRETWVSKIKRNKNGETKTCLVTELIKKKMIVLNEQTSLYRYTGIVSRVSQRGSPGS